MTCARCGKPRPPDTRRYCSHACAQLAVRKLDISKDELAKLVWEIPTTEIARRFGVSDVAVAKRCRRFGIAKPPRGYWALRRSIEADEALLTAEEDEE